MTMEQILTWLLGPGVGVAISYLLDQNVNWQTWKPAPLLGFSPKAIIINIVAGIVGVLSYGVATARPDIIATADPIVQVWFPLLAPIAVQLWHAFVNKRLTATEIKATISPGSGDSASITATAQSGGAPIINGSDQTTSTSISGSNSPGQGA